MILLDTSGVLAAVDSSQDHHHTASEVLRRSGRRILSPFVLAELDYLITTRIGQRPALGLLRDVAAGAYELAPFDSHDVAASIAILETYPDLGLGLADASLVVLAARLGCFDILTLDHRHFRAVLGPAGQPFRLLPQDG